ncbi:MAG: hypothetical protein RL151_32 [Bacteroidota bacterium]
MLLAWILPIALMFSPPVHPYYVSVTEIEYNLPKKELGVACKFFVDDLEEAIKEAGAGKTDLIKGERSRNLKLLEDYLKAHLGLSLDGKKIDLKFIGYELDQEAIWCFMEATSVDTFKRLSIRGDMLFELRKDQINLFHATVNGVRKSQRLALPDRTFTLEFNN